MQDGWRGPIFINTVGHSAGALLFCVVIALLIRDWRSHGLCRTGLSLVAAALALGWNLGSLIVLASRDLDFLFISGVATASFSMLTMLPAVLLHVAVQGRRSKIVLTGYVVSSLSVLLHIGEQLSLKIGLHQTALLLIACGFSALAIVSFLLGCRRKDHFKDRSESVSIACLLLFACSFLHFGYQHITSPWAAEITWHHIGVPVALMVLLRDYRFLLLDTFLRFVVNFGLAAFYVAGVGLVSFHFRLWETVRGSMFVAGLVSVMACLSLILFAHFRNVLQSWMSRAIFRRHSVTLCLEAIETFGRTTNSEQELLSNAASEIAHYLRTDFCAIIEPLIRQSGSTGSNILGLAEIDTVRVPFHPEAQIPLRLSSGEIRYLMVGPRKGGQRYWNEDVNDMRQIGASLVGQVERYRAEELKRLVSEAELRALQAQINPHFLFNALNTLYGTIDRGSRDARRMVLNLSDIFRYVMQGHRTLIPLGEELRIVEAYLEIEALRLGERLQSDIVVTAEAKSTLIPILSIQPLVENAIKHGVGSRSEPCQVTITVQIEFAGVRVTVKDTGCGFAQTRTRPSKGAGIGLDNVRKRLALSFGPAATLEILSDDGGASVSFLVPSPPGDPPAVREEVTLKA